MKTTHKRLNVLHFVKIVSRNDFVDSIVSHLDPKLFNVSVVTLDDYSITFPPLFLEKGLPHTNLRVKNAWHFQKILPALSRIISQEKIDLVHAHLFEEQFAAAFLRMRHPKVRFVIGRHYSDEIYLLHAGAKRKIWVGLENFANRMATRIIAGSAMVRDILLRQGVPDGKIVRLPYGFDFGDLRYQKNTPEQTAGIRKKHGIEPGDLMFVNVGRLFRLKGQELLIQVFTDLYKKYPHIRLVIVGGGDQETMLKKRVEELGLNQVIYLLGWTKNAHEYISAADVVVHPTLSEMFSQLMIESMAHGKPLIINDVSAVQDVITHGENGYICTHTYADWYAAMEKFILDGALRERLGAAAEKHVKDSYPVETIVKRYESLYHSIAE